MLFLYDLAEESWKRWQTLAAECQRRLAEQQIAPGNPGSILKDVEQLLEFVGPKGIVTKGPYANWPPVALRELNLKASHPVELGLKRPVLRDYPNLSGIYILLRVMDLLQRKGSRLVVSLPALDFWRRLNFAEQYFALLEALLFNAQSSVLGRANRQELPEAFQTTAVFLGHLSDCWRSFDTFESIHTLGPQGALPSWNVFLQHQFGLTEIQPKPLKDADRKNWGGYGWLIGAAKLTAWGTAVTGALLVCLKAEMEETPESSPSDSGAREQSLEFGEGANLLLEPSPGGQNGDASDSASGQDSTALEEEPNESWLAQEFGILQPIFQPYVPEWKTVYERPNREARSGTYIFKVTLTGWRGKGGGIWRRMAVPSRASLEDLAAAILSAFKFDDDHLYDFRYSDKRGLIHVYNRPGTSEGPFTSEIKVGEIELELEDKMVFSFDYGDGWQFDVLLERIDPGACRFRRPKLIASAGKAPQQYPDSEW